MVSAAAAAWLAMSSVHRCLVLPVARLSLPLCGVLVINKFDVMRCKSGADQRSVLNTNYLLMQHLVSAH